MSEFPCWCGFFNADYVCDEHRDPDEIPRLAIYIVYDPETDEVDVHGGDEDWEMIIALLEWTLERLREGAAPGEPA